MLDQCYRIIRASFGRNDDHAVAALNAFNEVNNCNRNYTLCSCTRFERYQIEICRFIQAFHSIIHRKKEGSLYVGPLHYHCGQMVGNLLITSHLMKIILPGSDFCGLVDLIFAKMKVCLDLMFAKNEGLSTLAWRVIETFEPNPSGKPCRYFPPSSCFCVATLLLPIRLSASSLPQEVTARLREL